MMLMADPSIALIKNQLIVMDKAFKDYGIFVYKTLQQNQIPVFWDYKYNLKKSLANANKKGAKFVIIIGEEEQKNNICTLKNLSNNSQKKLTLEEIIKQLS